MPKHHGLALWDKGKRELRPCQGFSHQELNSHAIDYVHWETQLILHRWFAIRNPANVGDGEFVVTLEQASEFVALGKKVLDGYDMILCDDGDHYPSDWTWELLNEFLPPSPEFLLVTVDIEFFQDLDVAISNVALLVAQAIAHGLDKSVLTYWSW